MENFTLDFDLTTHAVGADNTVASTNTGTGALATKPQAFYDKMLLELRRQREFGHRKLAQSRPMPKNHGDTIQFRKISKLAVSTTPLTEGVTPTGSTGSTTAISATAVQYGDFMAFSDKVSFINLDDTLKEYTREQGHQANETLDTLSRDELAGGSTVYYAAARTARTGLLVGDIPTINDLRKAVLQMKKNHVKPSLNGKYAVIITPEVAYDLMDDPKFEKAYEIGQNNKPFIEGEVADLYQMKFIEQVNGKVFAGGGGGTPAADVHASIVLGNQAYGVTTIKGQGDIKAIVKGLGSSGTEDPLNQRQTIGWKVNAFVTKRLDEDAIARYESVPTQA